MSRYAIGRSGTVGQAVLLPWLLDYGSTHDLHRLFIRQPPLRYSTSNRGAATCLVVHDATEVCSRSMAILLPPEPEAADPSCVLFAAATLRDAAARNSSFYVGGDGQNLPNGSNSCTFGCCLSPVACRPRARPLLGQASSFPTSRLTSLWGDRLLSFCAAVYVPLPGFITRQKTRRILLEACCNYTASRRSPAWRHTLSHRACLTTRAAGREAQGKSDRGDLAPCSCSRDVGRPAPPFSAPDSEHLCGAREKACLT